MAAAQSLADGFYVFNSFAENSLSPDEQWLSAWREVIDGAGDKYWLEDGPGITLVTLEGVVRHLLPDPDECP
ncbi:hypothetical protein BH11MYX4_BH11MYX4_60440 [soil metagenome]